MDILLSIFSGVGVVIIPGLGWIAILTIRHQAILKNLDATMRHKTNEIKDRIESFHDSQLNKKIKLRQSPLSLSPYAIALLEEVNFYSVFDKIKGKLVKELDDFKLRTKYDAQEMSDFLVRKKKDDTIFDELKGQVFQKGQQWEEVIAAMSIPLRDYYLSIHPEIKQ